MEKRIAGNSLSTMKILIVEDELESRVLLKALLDGLGVTGIYEASDAQSALLMMDGAFGNHIDAVLCDWNLPVISGLDFLRKLRAGGNGVPFVIITGRNDRKSVLEARACGADGYIRKPYSLEQMEEKLHMAALRKQAF